MTNAIKCRPNTTDGKLKMDREKDRALLAGCATFHLYKELRAAKPKLIIPMGAFACAAIDTDINLELQHGFPIKTNWGWTFPMYHPAGGIHEPKKMLLIRNDWYRLRQYLKGKLKLPVDPFAGSEDYRLIEDPYQINEDLAGMQDCSLACDTETTRKKQPFCLTYSVKPGTARLIRAEDKESLAQFQRHLNEWESEILWHNWLFDYGVTKRMGLTFPRRLIRDTMKDAFHLGNIPKGLKALSFRHLGMTMEDFDDVVRPHSTARVVEYYRRAQELDWEKPDQQLVRDPKTAKWKLYSPQSMSTKLKRFFTDYTKNPLKDVFEMWEKNWEDEQEVIEAACGEWPGKCISHVPFELAKFYACRDADALLRLAPMLTRAIRGVRRKPQETWMEA
jgi:hypothetical protein